MLLDLSCMVVILVLQLYGICADCLLSYIYRKFIEIKQIFSGNSVMKQEAREFKLSNLDSPSQTQFYLEKI